MIDTAMIVKSCILLIMSFNAIKAINAHQFRFMGWVETLLKEMFQNKYTLSVIGIFIKTTQTSRNLPIRDIAECLILGGSCVNAQKTLQIKLPLSTKRQKLKENGMIRKMLSKKKPALLSP